MRVNPTRYNNTPQGKSGHSNASAPSNRRCARAANAPARAGAPLKRRHRHLVARRGRSHPGHRVGLRGILLQIGKLKLELIQQYAVCRGLAEPLVPQLPDRVFELLDQRCTVSKSSEPLQKHRQALPDRETLERFFSLSLSIQLFKRTGCKVKLNGAKQRRSIAIHDLHCGR